MGRLVPAGLFGGSFDPPHVGHVALVQAALDILRLSTIWVVPVETPVHRQLSGKADARRRYLWLARMYAGMPAVEMLDWEVGLSTPTPTLPTLLRLRREFPDFMPVLLLGEDSFAGIEQWVGYPEHCHHADIAVFRRSGRGAAPVPAGWQEVDVRTWHSGCGPGRIVRIKAPLPGVSATQIRSMAAAGRSLRGLVPDVIRSEVESYYGPGEAC